jgi:hypothetical protein
MLKSNEHHSDHLLKVKVETVGTTSNRYGEYKVAHYGYISDTHWPLIYKNNLEFKCFFKSFMSASKE